MLILSLDPAVFGQFILLSLFILVTAFFFAVFVTLNQDRKIFYGTLPAALLSAYLLLPSNTNLVLSIGTLLVFILLYLSIERKLTGYITFDPDALLSSEVRQAATLLLLIGTIGFYISLKDVITTRGFTLPQSITDTFTALATQQQGGNTLNQQLPLTTQDSQIIKQLGLDQALPVQTATISSTIKQRASEEINKQISSYVKPYEAFIPAALSFFFFLTIRSFISLLSIFLGPVLRLFFWFLDRTKYTKYEIETRQVKKLVV